MHESMCFLLLKYFLEDNNLGVVCSQRSGFILRKVCRKWAGGNGARVQALLEMAKSGGLLRGGDLPTV